MYSLSWSRHTNALTSMRVCRTGAVASRQQATVITYSALIQPAKRGSASTKPPVKPADPTDSTRQVRAPKSQQRKTCCPALKDSTRQVRAPKLQQRKTCCPALKDSTRQVRAPKLQQRKTCCPAFKDSTRQVVCKAPQQVAHATRNKESGKDAWLERSGFASNEQCKKAKTKRCNSTKIA
eukprot:scaffold158787_cov21-Tisochrysis_lutea.AAC.2